MPPEFLLTTLIVVLAPGTGLMLGSRAAIAPAFAGLGLKLAFEKA